MISSGGVVLPGLRASGCLVLPVSRRHASWGRWWIVPGLGGWREPWAWLALLGCVVRASAFVVSGFFGLRGGAWGRGVEWAIPSLQKDSPRLFSPSSIVLLLYCTWFVHGLYSLLVWVWFVVLCAWVRGGGWCVPCVGMVGMVGAWWGGGEKGKNSGGGCDHERKSSTPNMSDLNRAALGYPTTEILVA